MITKVECEMAKDGWRGRNTVPGKDGECGRECCGPGLKSGGNFKQNNNATFSQDI